MDLLFGLATSFHLGFEKNYNMFHPHIRLENENIAAGLYYNSMKKVSTYVGYTVDLDILDLEFGAVTGYDDYFSVVIPYARLSKDLGKQTMFITPVGEKVNGKYRQGVVIGIELFLNK